MEQSKLKWEEHTTGLFMVDVPTHCLLLFLQLFTRLSDSTTGTTIGLNKPYKSALGNRLTMHLRPRARSILEDKCTSNAIDLFSNECDNYAMKGSKPI